MAKMVAFVTSIGENKIRNIATFISNVKEAYKTAMDSYGTAIIKVKVK
ncbi:hypothetical protein V7199_28225 [Priestia megaterium]|uniref:Uncharacterized protein n=1 Tax=Priestia megaterium TaxID=1404 RepID=A0ABD4WM10_PRIMG|nr:hypothetical protein [Priestia megaterium]MDD9781260.1 hypothetical protein [Priestia megaterium]